MSTVCGTRAGTNVVPFDEHEAPTVGTPFVDASLLASSATDDVQLSTSQVSIINESERSSSTLPSWCKSNPPATDESGARISMFNITDTTTIADTTTKQSRTVSLGEDESSPTKKLKSTNTGMIFAPFSYNGSNNNNNNTRNIPDEPKWQRELQLIAPRQSNSNAITLLANPKDKLVLSDLHVFVRQQIEVFTATEADIAQPAPGRKHRIQLDQVGLRCIHCRNLPSRDRVKRAVCYPSSIARVYHSVSDMKFDHFAHCKGRPPEVCAMFQSLKEKKPIKKSAKLVNPNSSSSTAQYYHDTALEMGMVDGPGGLYMTNNKSNLGAVASSDGQGSMDVLNHSSSSPFAEQYYSVPQKLNRAALPIDMKYNKHELLYSSTNPDLQHDFKSASTSNVLQQQHPQLPLAVPQRSNTITLLANHADKLVLSQLHIFVRQQIEVFAATESEITQPSPGRKIRVVLGQVGLRCIHCANIPVKDRVKRAVCYPAAISGIYHAVSNMKFDHFDKCRALPSTARDLFATLRSSCGRHGPRNGGSNCSSNSTAQYYHDSAIALGLVDSENGIRFQDTSNAPSTDSVQGHYTELHSPVVESPPPKQSCTLSSESNCSTDGISALMIAAQRQQKIKIVKT